MCHDCLRKDLIADIKSLGLEFISIGNAAVRIVFKSEEDLNYYKLVGKYYKTANDFGFKFSAEPAAWNLLELARGFL